MATGNRQRSQASGDIPDRCIAILKRLGFDLARRLSISVSSVNEKVPLASYCHPFFVYRAQVDWDSVQDVVDRLMRLPCFHFLTLLEVYTGACSPPRGARLQLFFYSNPPSFKSASPSAPLGSNVEIRLAEHLWNYLKALYNVLLNFGYRGNTTATDSFTAFWKVSCSRSNRHSVVHALLSFFHRLLLQLADHKWWAPLAGLLPVILIKVLIKGKPISAAISSRAATGHAVGECRRSLDHIFHQGKSWVMQLFGALSDLHFITQPASMCFHTTLRPLHIFKKIYVLASNKTALTHTTSSMHTAPKIASLEFLIHAEMFFFFFFWQTNSHCGLSNVSAEITHFKTCSAKACWRRLLKKKVELALRAAFLKLTPLRQSVQSDTSYRLLNTQAVCSAMLRLPGSQARVGSCQTIPDAWQEVGPYRGSLSAS